MPVKMNDQYCEFGQLTNPAIAPLKCGGHPSTQWPRPVRSPAKGDRDRRRDNPALAEHFSLWFHRPVSIGWASPARKNGSLFPTTRRSGARDLFRNDLQKITFANRSANGILRMDDVPNRPVPPSVSSISLYDMIYHIILANQLQKEPF